MYRHPCRTVRFRNPMAAARVLSQARISPPRAVLSFAERAITCGSTSPAEARFARDDHELLQDVLALIADDGCSSRRIRRLPRGIRFCPPTAAANLPHVFIVVHPAVEIKCSASAIGRCPRVSRRRPCARPRTRGALEKGLAAIAASPQSLAHPARALHRERPPDTK